MKLRKVCLLILALMMLSNSAFAGALPKMILPAALRIIDEEAFMNDGSIKRVEVPEGTLEIRERAFAYSSVTDVVLPASLTYIADDAFEGCELKNVIVKKGSYAHWWAGAKGYVFPNPATTFRALLIGNTYPGTSMELNAPDDDVAGIERMLARQTDTGYDVTTAFNLTADQMLSAITTAFDGADSDDVSLFYYSGHGNTTSDSERLGALCGTGSTYVTVSELRAHLDTIPGDKIVLLDCCHSGAYISRSSAAGNAESFNDSVIAAFSMKSRSTLESGGYTVLTACSQTESSWELTLSNGRGVGFFSYGIAKGSGYDSMNQVNCTMYADDQGDQNNRTSLGEAYDYAAEVVGKLTAQYNVTQNIQYYGNTEFILWAGDGEGSSGDDSGTSDSETPADDTDGVTTCRALLVGNVYEGTDQELFGPDDNTAALKSVLEKQVKTPYEITVKADLTADQMLNAITSTFEDADDDDVSLFFYSGHGLDSAVPAFLGALCGTNDTTVTVSNLRYVLDTVPGEKIVLLDSCHSGAFIGKSAESEAETVSAKAFNDAVIAAFAAESKSNLATGGYHVITACSQSESGYELYDLKTGYGYSFFACGLIAGSGYDPRTKASCAMHADNNGDGNGATSLVEAYDYAAEVVSGFAQSYSLSTNVQYYGEEDFVLWAK